MNSLRALAAIAALVLIPACSDDSKTVYVQTPAPAPPGPPAPSTSWSDVHATNFDVPNYTLRVVQWDPADATGTAVSWTVCDLLPSGAGLLAGGECIGQFPTPPTGWVSYIEVYTHPGWLYLDSFLLTPLLTGNTTYLPLIAGGLIQSSGQR